MKLVELSVRRPVGVIMLVLAIMALGFVSLKNLAIDLYPKMNIPIAVIMTSYPGAAPQEVEKSVSQTIESAVGSIQGIDSIQSTSQPGSSMVIMMFDSGVNLDATLNDIRERVDQVKGLLPEEAGEPSVLRFDPQQIPVMWVGLTGDRPETLQSIAEDVVKPYFERSKDVASVSIEGGKTREIQLELDRGKLAQYGITPMQVTQALGSENRSSSPGVISKGDRELQIRIDGVFGSLQDIKDTLITLPAGGQVTVSDVAEMKDTFKKSSSISVVNGEPALVLSVIKKSDGNTVEVADGLHKTIKDLEGKIPEGVSLSIIMDTSDFIRQSINSVVNNMIVGAFFSVIVLLFFLRSIRAIMVIGISIPIAVISTFTLMYFTGETLNVISMGGLALGIGMMVDSSIVILESIYGYREKGSSIIDSAIKGSSELASAVIASTTTSLVVFLPIVFTQGIASDIFTPLALTVSFSLIASLMVSLTLVPMLSSKLLASTGGVIKKGLFDAILDKVMSLYKRSLGFVINRRKLTIITVVVALVGSLALVPFIGAELMPAADQGQIQITVEATSGAKLEETKAITDEVNKLLEPYKESIKTNYLSIGSGGAMGGGFSTGSNRATYTILLVGANDRDITTTQVVKELSEALQVIPGAEIAVTEQGASMGQGDPVQIKLIGPEREVLEELAQQVTWLISDVKGIYHVESSVSEGRPEVLIDINREAATQYGLSYQQIMTEVELGFNGKIATRYRENGQETDVRVILPEDKRGQIIDLESTYVQAPTGALIPLSAVATLKQVEGPVQIERENQQRQVTVSAKIEGRDLNSITKDIESKLTQINFPEGYSYTSGGQSADMAESFADLALALIFAIFLVYAVMAIQFESFIQPFIIMFSMPTAVIGILVGLFMTGHSLSITAFIGIIMLAGIVVNNAIVLVDYINILRSRGLSREEAILEAGPSRLRPILMTTLTTVLGMIPLALGIGEGAEAQAPLAIVIIFGLSFSTLLTLLFVPVMYIVMDNSSIRWKDRFKRLSDKVFRRKKKVQQEIM